MYTEGKYQTGHLSYILIVFWGGMALGYI